MAEVTGADREADCCVRSKNEKGKTAQSEDGTEGRNKEGKIFFMMINKE